MFYLAQQVLNGLHVGALYGVLAFGYALSHALLHRTNLAYGAIFAFTGQIMILAVSYAWFVLWLVWPLALAIGVIVALGYAVLTGAALGRFVLRPLADRSPNTVVTATLGVAIALMEWLRIATDTRDVWLAPTLATPVHFLTRPDGFRVTLTVLQIAEIVVAVIVLTAIARWLATSRFGREWRAMSDDPRAAELCGVDTGAIFVKAMVASALVAAFGGVLAGAYYGNLNFGTGLVFGLKVLFLSALGGFDAPWKAALGGVAFGMAETVWSGYFPLEWRDVAVFAALAAILVLRGPADDHANVYARRP